MMACIWMTFFVQLALPTLDEATFAAWVCVDNMKKHMSDEHCKDNASCLAVDLIDG